MPDKYLEFVIGIGSILLVILGVLISLFNAVIFEEKPKNIMTIILTIVADILYIILWIVTIQKLIDL